MKAETLQLAIECVEEERIRVEDMMNWWGPGTSRHKRYANELSMLNEALADLRQEVTWEPVPNGKYSVCQDKDGEWIYRKINEYPASDYFTVSGRIGYNWLAVSLPDNWQLIHRKPQPDKEYHRD